MPKPSEVLIFVNEDGSARELTEADKKYVDTDFSPFDGARPYIKTDYDQRTLVGGLRGFLAREKLPDSVPVHPAPPEPPPQVKSPAQAASEILDLIGKMRQRR